jgi:ADP-heptose:LPS heptosyltransferase
MRGANASDRPRDGQSPLRGRYLVNDWRLRGLLTASDVLLRGRTPERVPDASSLRRVLLSFNGHLGDAVIATAAIKLFGEALPNVELGVLLPSWSRPVVEGLPSIRYLHSIDHWHTNRILARGFARWQGWRRSRRLALAEVRRLRYDAAVDLYDYFPNASMFLWHAGIPVRVGYDAAGFSGLYTHALVWPDDAQHTAERQASLLRVLAPSIGRALPQGSLPSARPWTVERVSDLLARVGAREGEFIVLHPGAGAPGKEWPIEQWRTLAEALVDGGETLLFTGKGPREHDAVRTIVDDLPRCFDVCDQVDWEGFVQLIRVARQVVSVDTVAGHVAATVDTPSITIWTGRNNPRHWGPRGATGTLLVPRDDAVVAADVLQAIHATRRAPAWSLDVSHPIAGAP